MNSKINRNTTERLVVTGVMLALAAVLSMIKIWPMPLGGSVTLLSMVPIIVIAARYGTKWGLFSAFVYSLIQIGLDLSSIMGWGLTVKMWVGSIMFDYLIPFTVLGLSAIFMKKGKFGLPVGVCMALSARFLSHVVSGVIFFGIWCPEGWNVWYYSLAYNGTYMLPELAFTVIAICVLQNVPAFKRILYNNKKI